MGSIRITLGAGAVVAAVLAPTASAADVQGVFLTPASPTPGTGVRLAVRGCAGTAGSAASDAFAGDARLVGRNGMLTGGTRVSATAHPGLYSVTVGCDGRKVEGVLTVSEPKAPAPSATPHGPASPAARVSSGAPAAPSSPVAPVHAGGGATAPLSSSDARSAGPGVLQAIIGLVLASVAAVVVIARSIRRGRGRE